MVALSPYSNIKKKKKKKVTTNQSNLQNVTKPATAPPTPVPEKTPMEGGVQPGEVFRDQTGRLAGITTPDGRVLLGLSPAEVREHAARFQQQTEVPQGAADPEVRLQQEREQKRQEQIQAEEQALIEGVQPIEERELSPEAVAGESIPLIGTAQAALQNTITSVFPKAFRGAKFQTVPELLQNEALTEIEKEVFDKGLTNNEKFGSLIEAIPVVGSLVSTYASGLIETPSSNIRDLEAQIEKTEQRAGDFESWVSAGIIKGDQALTIIDGMQDNLQRMESRIKLLTIHSPRLRTNRDKVDEIQIKILRAKERIQKNRLIIERNTIRNQEPSGALLGIRGYLDE